MKVELEPKEWRWAEGVRVCAPSGKFLQLEPLKMRFFGHYKFIASFVDTETREQSDG